MTDVAHIFSIIASATLMTTAMNALFPMWGIQDFAKCAVSHLITTKKAFYNHGMRPIITAAYQKRKPSMHIIYSTNLNKLKIQLTSLEFLASLQMIES